MLAYGVTALAVPGVNTNTNVVFANPEDTMYAQNYLEAEAETDQADNYLAQVDYDDEYSYDLAQTYSE